MSYISNKLANFFSHFSSKKFTQTSTLDAILAAILATSPTNLYLQLGIALLVSINHYYYTVTQGGIDSISAKNALNQVIKNAIPVVEAITVNQPEVHQAVEEAKPVIEEVTQEVSDPTPVVIPVDSQLSASVTAILENAKSIISNLENTKNLN